MMEKLTRAKPFTFAPVPTYYSIDLFGALGGSIIVLVQRFTFEIATHTSRGGSVSAPTKNKNKNKDMDKKRGQGQKIKQEQKRKQKQRKHNSLKM